MKIGLKQGTDKHSVFSKCSKGWFRETFRPLKTGTDSTLHIQIIFNLKWKF